MSELSNLSELARFVSRSRSATSDTRRRAVGDGDHLFDARPQRRSVGELLSVVLILSARTRRMVMPRVSIDLDVFAPGGRRAIRMTIGPHR